MLLMERKDTSKYCWSKKKCPKFDSCQPLGYTFADWGDYSEGWYFADNGAPNSERSNLNECTEFEPN